MYLVRKKGGNAGSVIVMMEGMDRFVESISHHAPALVHVGPKAIFVQISGDVCNSTRNYSRVTYGGAPACPFMGSLDVMFNTPLGSSIKVGRLAASIIHIGNR
ncbi:MAG: hypothetical protein V4660_05930 [Pseudomonadota bacterium]